MADWPETVYVALGRGGKQGPYASVLPGGLHERDPETWEEREYLSLSKVKERLLSQGIEAAARSDFEKAYPRLDWEKAGEVEKEAKREMVRPIVEAAVEGSFPEEDS